MDISKEELYKAIGTKIRAMRTAKGWTQEELGNKFDVSPQYISRIERGSAHLSLQMFSVRVWCNGFFTGAENRNQSRVVG